MEIKRRIWLMIQLPVVLLWTIGFLIAECGDERLLENATLREDIYPTLRRMGGFYTDLKFRWRGAEPTQQKIVVVEIDDRAVEEVGRWPWHRDALALLIQQAADAGAKVIGIDIVFAEPDQRVPDGVVELLTEKGLRDEIPQFETDLMLQRILALNRSRVVLGWMTDRWCRPAYDGEQACPVTSTAALPADFAKFGYSKSTMAVPFDAAGTPIVSAPTVLANLPSYNAAAAHSGYLVNAAEDSDDVVRRAQAVIFVGGHPQPSLPLAMARVGLGDDLELELDDDGRVAHIGFAKSGLQVPVDATGTMSINFRGPGYHFPYVGALDLLGDDELIPVQSDGVIEKKPRNELFKDAYVLIGVSAIGARDLRHFPFGNNIPGTEGLATILDNVLTGDLLQREGGILEWRLLLVLMTLGAILFGQVMFRLEALWALLVSLGVIGTLIVIDIAFVFSVQDVDLNSIFLLAELVSIFVVTLAVKYVLEERNKKFIRGTFSKYLAPAVVDEMLKDPSKMQLGGENRRLTIMMSDLRGFTAMAERLKPEQVLTVLNHYLGTMADIIVDYGGTIDEFIGDAILVIFGAPIAKPDDARRAVACTIAMQRAMKGINEHNAALGLPKIEMGIALNTGEVIVGNIGSMKHIKYGVVGSHVNLTARIESNTVGGQILISGTTLELAGAEIKIGEKQLIIAKGFPDPIPAFEIKGIGGEHNLYVEEVDLGLVDLAAPAEVRYRIMKSKNEEGPEQTGKLVSVSPMGAMLEGEGELESFKNLKIRVVAASGELVDGDLYAKVIEGGARAQLRFTAVPPLVTTFIAERLEQQAPERSSDLAERS